MAASGQFPINVSWSLVCCEGPGLSHANVYSFWLLMEVGSESHFMVTVYRIDWNNNSKLLLVGLKFGVSFYPDMTSWNGGHKRGPGWVNWKQANHILVHHVTPYVYMTYKLPHYSLIPPKILTYSLTTFPSEMHVSESTWNVPDGPKSGIGISSVGWLVWVTS